tara:strand:- start:480 stop:674 length:195 start_codon:yes stop_codon:yes gene_type:complete
MQNNGKKILRVLYHNSVKEIPQHNPWWQDLYELAFRAVGEKEDAIVSVVLYETTENKKEIILRV